MIHGHLIDLQIVDGCPSETTRIPALPGFPEFFIDIHWPETNLGDTAVVECPCGGVDLNSTGLIATRQCGGSYTSGAIWLMPNDIRCNFSITTRRICDLARVTFIFVRSETIKFFI